MAAAKRCHVCWDISLPSRFAIESVRYVGVPSFLRNADRFPEGVTVALNFYLYQKLERESSKKFAGAG